MNDNRSAMRKTIVARIATFDTSIPNPTPEQVSETLRLLGALKQSLGASHKDFALVVKLEEALARGPRPRR